MRLYVVRFDGSPHDPRHPRTYLTLWCGHVAAPGNEVKTIRSHRQRDALRMCKRDAQRVALCFGARVVRIVRRGEL